MTVPGRAHFLPAANNSVRLLHLGREVKLTMDFSDMQHQTAAFLARRTTYNHCVRLRLCPDLRQVVLGQEPPPVAGVVLADTVGVDPNWWKKEHLEYQLLWFIMTLTSDQFVNIALVISWWETHQLGEDLKWLESQELTGVFLAGQIEPNAAPVLWSPTFFFLTIFLTSFSVCARIMTLPWFLWFVSRLGMLVWTLA